jgi:hypothetical protein
MVKVLATAFVALLVYAHAVDPQGEAYFRPLSTFRDFGPAWIGYALFGMLLAVGAGTARTAFRVQNEAQMAVYMLLTAMLAFVLATPSNDFYHIYMSLLLMAAMIISVGVVLWYNDSVFWFVMHLLAPTILMWGTRLESFGVWQKGLILYFLAATIAHEGILARGLPKRGKRQMRKVKVTIRVARRRPMGLDYSTTV